MPIESPQENKFDLRKTKDKEQLVKNLLKQLAENLISRSDYPYLLKREDFGDLLPRLMPELLNAEDGQTYKVEVGLEDDPAKGVRIIVFDKNKKVIDALEWSDIDIELKDPTPKILASIRKELKKLDFGGKQELSLQTSDLSHEMYQSLLDLTGRKMFHGWVSQIKFKIIGDVFQIELRSEDNKLQDLLEFPSNN